MVTMLKPRIATHSTARQVQHTAATTRTRGSQWMSIRARVMTRDCGLCQACKRAGRLTLATEVDHIKPHYLGGGDDMRNLQALCRECHARKSLAEASSRACGGV
jgi:5-methylcytosine-specific restriction protein A